MSYIEYNAESNMEEIIKEGLTIVDFYAEWCGPCKMIAPVFNKLSSEMTDIKFVKVDVDNNKEVSGQYNVKSIPTLIIFKDGKQIDQKLGFVPEPVLKEWIVANK